MNASKESSLLFRTVRWTWDSVMVLGLMVLLFVTGDDHPRPQR